MMFFFFNDTATTEIYTLSLHDALPIYGAGARRAVRRHARGRGTPGRDARGDPRPRRGLPHLARLSPARVLRGLLPRLRPRSEEHTSELQSRQYLVCRLLLEKTNVRYPF